MRFSVSCPVCGRREFSVIREEREIRAHDGTMLPYSAEYSKCVTCGEEFFSQAQSRAASKAAVSAQRAHAAYLTPYEILAIRKKLGVTQEELQNILKLGKKSVVRWEAGTVCQSRAADQLLRQIAVDSDLLLRLAREAGVKLRVFADGATRSSPSATQFESVAFYVFAYNVAPRKPSVCESAQEAEQAPKVGYETVLQRSRTVQAERGSWVLSNGVVDHSERTLALV